MNKQIEHAAPFIGYLFVCLAAAAVHLFFTPLVFAGARGINGSIFTPVGLMAARPLGVILCALPPLMIVVIVLSYRFPMLRSVLFIAALGCGLASLLLLYACALAYPLIERAWLQT